MIYADPHENIREAIHADIPDILKIMRPFVKENVLIPAPPRRPGGENRRTTPSTK